MIYLICEKEIPFDYDVKNLILAFIPGENLMTLQESMEITKTTDCQIGRAHV